MNNTKDSYVSIPLDTYEKLKRKSIDNYITPPSPDFEKLMKDAVDKLHKEGGFLFATNIRGYYGSFYGYVNSKELSDRLDAISRIPKWIRKLIGIRL